MLTEVLGNANDLIQRDEFDKEGAAKRSERDGKEKEKDKYQKDKKSDSSGGKEENNSVKKGRERQRDRYHNYTPLTVSRAELYELNKKDDKWQKPMRISTRVGISLSGVNSIEITVMSLMTIRI